MEAWNKTEQIFFFFFPLANYGVSWTARPKLLLSYLNMTFFTVLLTSDVPHHATWILEECIRVEKKGGKFAVSYPLTELPYNNLE